MSNQSLATIERQQALDLRWEDVLPEGDESIVTMEAESLWMANDSLAEIALKRAVDMVTICRVKQGAILRAINERYGRKAKLAFCERMGVTERTASNYMSLYDNRHREFLLQLPPSAAYKSMKLLSDGALTVSGSTLTFEDGRQIDLDGELDRGTLVEVINAAAATAKELKAAQKKLEKINETHSAETAELVKAKMDAERALRERVGAVEGVEWLDALAEIEQQETESREYFTQLMLTDFTIEQKVEIERLIAVREAGVAALRTILENRWYAITKGECENVI